MSKFVLRKRAAKESSSRRWKRAILRGVFFVSLTVFSVSAVVGGVSRETPWFHYTVIGYAVSIVARLLLVAMAPEPTRKIVIAKVVAIGCAMGATLVVIANRCYGFRLWIDLVVGLPVFLCGLGSVLLLRHLRRGHGPKASDRI